MNDFKVGFYGRTGKKAVVLALDKKNSTRIGFIFNSNDSQDGTFGDDWVSTFNIEKDDFFISNDMENQILNELKESESVYLEKVILFFKKNRPFIIKGRFLIKEDEMIPISSILRIKKIDNDFIELNIYGEIKKINFMDYDNLLYLMTKEEL